MLDKNAIETEGQAQALTLDGRGLSVCSPVSGLLAGRAPVGASGGGPRVWDPFGNRIHLGIRFEIRFDVIKYGLT